MTTMIRIKARLTPWDDREFVHTFEQARHTVEATGCCPEGPAAAEAVQRRLRDSGYPDARVEVERTAAEALSHVSHWDVRRDG